MKKFFIRLVACCILLMVAVYFAACASQSKLNERIDGHRFQLVYEYQGNEMIYVDKETGVQYMFKYAGYGGFCVSSVLVDADGKPILYEEGE